MEASVGQGGALLPRDTHRPMDMATLVVNVDHTTKPQACRPDTPALQTTQYAP